MSTFDDIAKPQSSPTQLLHVLMEYTFVTSTCSQKLLHGMSTQRPSGMTSDAKKSVYLHSHVYPKTRLTSPQLQTILTHEEQLSTFSEYGNFHAF